MQPHISVLYDVTLEELNIKSNGIYVDCTLGAGGHSSGILQKLNVDGHLYAFDQDGDAREIAETRLSAINNNYTIIPQNFVTLKSALLTHDVKSVDGILFDIGVSSMQFDQEQRGFSYRFDAPLDMRMNQAQKLSAYDVVNAYEQADLVRIFYEYGEENFARNIAKHIISARAEKPIKTTFELIEVIRRAIPMKKQKEKHPAKKVFQAIRIEVNNELQVFTDALEQAVELLNPNGRLVVITFHSLEDKICKKIFNKYGKIKGPENPLEKLQQHQEQTEVKIITRKPVLANEQELTNNPRAKSAKLRVIEKNTRIGEK